MADRARSPRSVVRPAAFLLLVALVVAAAGARSTAGADPDPLPDAALFAAELPIARELRLDALDPVTLADLSRSS